MNLCMLWSFRLLEHVMLKGSVNMCMLTCAYFCNAISVKLGCVKKSIYDSEPLPRHDRYPALDEDRQESLALIVNEPYALIDWMREK